MQLHPCCVYAHFPSCLIIVLLPEYGESGVPDFNFWYACHQVLIRGNGEDESKRWYVIITWKTMEACSAVSNR